MLLLAQFLYRMRFITYFSQVIIRIKQHPLSMSFLLHNLVHLGVKQEDDMETRRQKGVINIACFLSLFTMTFFIVLNIVNKNWVLLFSNGVLVVLTLCMLLVARVKHKDAAVFVLALLFSIYFLLCGVLFHNGQHFALISCMVLGVLLINSRIARLTLLLIQVAFFIIFLCLQNKPSIIAPLPSYRYNLVVLSLLLILCCILEFFKSKQLQNIQKLNRANEQLRENNKVKERMLSILSHDFKGPVGNLVTTLNMFDSGVLTETEVREISGRLKAQLQVLTISLTDVLHWSKIQISGEAGQAANASINALLVEIHPLFNLALQEKNLTLINNISQDITVFVNIDHLKLIFRNLLSNAIKFSFAGGSIYINAKADNNLVTVSIKDEGTGMQPELLTALQNDTLNFTSSPGTAKERGTGLGLMLVRDFLHKSNGRLTISSEPGKGSTFAVTLPAGSNH